MRNPATRPARPDQPDDKSLLGSVVAATTEDLNKAARCIQFELALRADRDNLKFEMERRSAERFAEVREYMESQFDGEPYDHEKDGL